MDETMDYAYHHQEQAQGQAQLPYSQQRSRCPYLNRNEHHQQPPNAPQQQQQQQQQQQRSTMHYDPVHASANYWHPPGQLPPYHWQPRMLGHRPQLVPQHRSSNSASEPHFYNQGPASSFGNGLGGYSGAPPNEMGGPQTMHPSFPHSQLPPPVRYVHSTPLAPSQPTASQPLFAPERAFGQNTTSRTGAFNTASHSMNTSTPSLTQESAEPSAEPSRASQTTTTESTGTPNQAPPPSTGIQFGSAPPSSAPQHHSPFPLSPYRAHRSAPSGETDAVAVSNLPLYHTYAYPGPSSSTSTSNFVPPNLRRAPGNPRRTMSRRQSPPSDGDMDSERELRMMEQVIHASGSAGRLVDGDHHVDPVRAAQFLRGSVTTKYVASSSAIQSLQSVPISDLPESERTCVICYNEYGVETPEGVKEAPLRLPKCKHVFGDHCIKKWLEDSDSCPYCRDKVPNEPRITSTNPSVNNILRARSQVTLGGYAGFMRERDANLSQDDSARLSATASSHGERRSPPTDSGESRRRIRPRHGTFRGPGSPPFSAVSRPGSFGASSAASHENNRRSHAAAAANRAYLSNTNTPPRTSHGSVAQVSFPGGNTHQYQVPSFGSMEPSSSATPPMPPYLQQGMHHGNSQGAHGASFPNPLNRSSVPAPLPGAWVSGLPPTSDNSHRRMMPGESNAQLQASTQWGQQ
ncbi:hypothetical protein LZ30DRAFT_745411 [Colletotrichum cereale]|nr:hypothetical protein LZ30DRAFT_745411 [Colletotrichum cereale]